MFRLGVIELLIVVALLGIPGIIAFVDILRSNFKGNDKLLWLAAVIFVPFVGSIAYFFLGWKQKIRGQHQ